MKVVKEVVHVPTRELAEEVLRVGAENGLMNNLDLGSLNPYYNNTCFELKKVSDYGVIEFYKKQGYKILTTQDFLDRYKPKFKPIAMKCTKKQFKTIKPKLAGCKVVCLSRFTDCVYLVNNLAGRKYEISNVLEKDNSDHNRQVFEEWNEKTFLEYCGINVSNEANELDQLRKENAELKKQLQAINDQPKVGDVCLFWDNNWSKGTFVHGILSSGNRASVSKGVYLSHDNCIKATPENIQAKINELKNE